MIPLIKDSHLTPMPSPVQSSSLGSNLECASRSDLLVQVEGINKRFTLHTQGGLSFPVLQDFSFVLRVGECVVLSGQSGSGKSTFLRCLYGNYRVDQGSIWIKHQNCWLDLANLEAHQLLEVRRYTIGYVSQFLRVIPRVPALDVAAEPLLELGIDQDIAYQTIQNLFTRLNLPERLWSLSPTTFSGGEKQRVNLARTFSVPYPIVLLDEPTSALDAANRQAVIDLILERKASGSAVVAIFHDQQEKEVLGDREFCF